MPGQAPPISDERGLLLAYLRQQRDGIRFAAYGLTDDQARLTPTAGALSIGGLVKHVTATERGWIDTMLQRSGQSADNVEELEAAYGDEFIMEPDETLEGLLADLDGVEAEMEAAVSGIADMGQDVPVPRGVPWFPDDVENWSVRWVLLHVIEEIARHAGHADIVRESIDGATMFELMAGAEGWPATDWLQPWEPPTDG